MIKEFLYYQFIELVRAGAIVIGFLLLERTWPVERQPVQAKLFNLAFALAAFAIITASAFFMIHANMFVLRIRYEFATASNFVSQHLGTIDLTIRILAYLLVVDFLSYWRHRAMHAWPLLWRIHELHHSETSINTTTARRDHWLNEFLYFASVNTPALLLFGVFDVPSGVLMAYVAFPFFTHANIRLALGPLTPVLNGPQLHRIHHSRLPEHADTNFAAMFPLYDIIFGTYRAPRAGEFAPTGLISGGTIVDQRQAHLSPFRRAAAQSS